MNKICPWIPAIVKRVSNRQNIISLEIKIQIKEKYFSSFNRSKSKMNYGKEIGTSSTSWISTSRKSKFFPCPKSNPGQCQFQDTLRQENSSLLPRRKYKNKFHWPCRRVRTADFRKYCRTVYPRGWNFQNFLNFFFRTAQIFKQSNSLSKTVFQIFSIVLVIIPEANWWDHVSARHPIVTRLKNTGTQATHFA